MALNVEGEYEVTNRGGWNSGEDSDKDLVAQTSEGIVIRNGGQLKTGQNI